MKYPRSRGTRTLVSLTFNSLKLVLKITGTKQDQAIDDGKVHPPVSEPWQSLQRRQRSSCLTPSIGTCREPRYDRMPKLGTYLSTRAVPDVDNSHSKMWGEGG